MKNPIFSTFALPFVLAAVLATIPAVQAGGGAIIPRRPNDQSRLTCESTWVSATPNAVLARLKSGFSFQLETTGGTATAQNDQVEIYSPNLFDEEGYVDVNANLLRAVYHIHALASRGRHVGPHGLHFHEAFPLPLNFTQKSANAGVGGQPTHSRG